jgi:hypothetical protein
MTGACIERWHSDFWSNTSMHNDDLPSNLAESTHTMRMSWGNAIAVVLVLALSCKPDEHVISATRANANGMVCGTPATVNPMEWSSFRKGQPLDQEGQRLWVEGIFHGLPEGNGEVSLDNGGGAESNLIVALESPAIADCNALHVRMYGVVHGATFHGKWAVQMVP